MELHFIKQLSKTGSTEQTIMQLVKLNLYEFYFIFKCEGAFITKHRNVVRYVESEYL